MQVKINKCEEKHALASKNMNHVCFAFKSIHECRKDLTHTSYEVNTHKLMNLFKTIKIINDMLKGGKKQVKKNNKIKIT